MIVELDQRSSEWLKWRSEGIGASDAAVILEESPFRTAYDLWLEKTGQRKSQKSSRAMDHGTEHEPDAIAWYTQQTDKKGRPVCAVYDDADYIRASLDFWDGAKHGAEVKCPIDYGQFRQHKEAIPYYYWVQCQVQMQTMDLATCDFVSWYEGDGVIHPVERDDNFWFETLLPAIQEFWQRVLDRRWPVPDGVRKLETPEWRDAARRFMDARAMVVEAEALKRRAEAALRRLATAKTTIGGGVRATWRLVGGRRELVVPMADDGQVERAMQALRSLGLVPAVHERAPSLSLMVKEVGEKD
jgi:putative phage-type endonuclease